jgi:hypothetical protein
MASQQLPSQLLTELGRDRGLAEAPVLVGVTGFEPVASAVRSECGPDTLFSSTILDDASSQLIKGDSESHPVQRVADRGGRAARLLTAPRIATGGPLDSREGPTVVSPLSTDIQHFGVHSRCAWVLARQAPPEPLGQFGGRLRHGSRHDRKVVVRVAHRRPGEHHRASTDSLSVEERGGQGSGRGV